MTVFSRWCFLRTRQLDAIGETSLADALLALARYSGSSDPARSAIWQHSIYQTLRRLIGSRVSGQLASLRSPRRKAAIR